jgi:hypothetical protein
MVVYLMMVSEEKLGLNLSPDHFCACPISRVSVRTRPFRDVRRLLIYCEGIAGRIAYARSAIEFEG